MVIIIEKVEIEGTEVTTEAITEMTIEAITEMIIEEIIITEVIIIGEINIITKVTIIEEITEDIIETTGETNIITTEAVDNKNGIEKIENLEKITNSLEPKGNKKKIK